MSRLKIKNFGPIVNGCNGDGFIDFSNVTVFIGNQGSGKSSVAKLFSTCSWIEKAYFRKEITDKELTASTFCNKFCEYQNIANYFKPDTELSYQGDRYTILYQNKQFSIAPSRPFARTYAVPKIMYVPAERNFLSVVDRPQQVPKLPKPLYTFLDELDKAENALAGEPLKLPINDIRFEYSKLNKLAYITGPNYKIRLSESSSGIQSLAPLYVVSRYLASKLHSSVDEEIANRSLEERRKIEEDARRIQNDQTLSAEVKAAELQRVYSRYNNDCFINIVEEIEQNLYPDSQKSILFALIAFMHEMPDSKLVLTTHSPYIVNYLTLAVKARSVFNKIVDQEFDDLDQKTILTQKLYDIVPKDALLPADELLIYEMKDDGSIEKLKMPNGLPSDDNYLNQFLAKTNDLFDQLLDIEDTVCPQ